MKRDMNRIVGSHDLVWIVLDSLRHDIACQEMAAGRTPNLAKLFPAGWEKRHSPASFTYPAHQAFFAGFLPTPADPTADQERPFATYFEGSTTSGSGTCLFREANIISGLAGRGYHTLCIGGVGFFNKRTPLSRVLPAYFAESHWSRDTGVMARDSPAAQFGLAAQRLSEIATDQRVFLFLNISAIHRPTRHYIAGKKDDDRETHAAALRHVDASLPLLTNALARRGPAHLLAFSDHGTLYGEDGFTGHRVGHPDVYTVPYAETLLPPA